MKAIVCRRYGPPEVLQLEEIEKPTPAENQVLIKVHAASINAADYRPRTGKPFLLRVMMGALTKPKDPLVGTDVAGVVEAVGAAVTRFRPGDEVFGGAHGSMAEFALAREGNLVKKPANQSFEAAAAVPTAAITALQGLRDSGKIQAGQRVVIQGASGGVGVFAVQIAKAFGAEVTGVCSTRNVEMVRSLGADYVMDYKKEDFTKNAQQYDLIFAVNGYHPLSAYKRALKPQGRYVCAGGTFPQIFQSMLLGGLVSEKGGRTLLNMGIAKFKQEDMVTLGEILAAGKLAPVIDRKYPLNETAAAFKYVEETHPQGKVVITIER